MIEEFYNKDNTVLKLPVSFNDSLVGIQFHPNLKRIELGYCYDKSLNNVIFPENLESIRIGADFDKSLSEIKLPNNFKLIEFPYNYTTITNDKPLSIDTLPHGISKIILSNILYPITNLPSSIKEIVILWPRDTDQELLKVPFDCKIICGYHGKQVA